MAMSDTDYFIQLAKRCRRLAQSCFDLSIAGALREIAAELEQRGSAPKATRQFQEGGAPTTQRARDRMRRPD
jgi:hypothetical protein